MYKVFSEIMVSENKILTFHEDFLNMDISLHVAHKSIKFLTYIYDIWMERSVSQNVDLGLSFNFIKCRN